MIDIKIDNQNEAMFVEHLKQFIQDNPILLNNLLEPCVNEMISDENIPEQLKARIQQLITGYFVEYPADTGIADIFKECIVEGKNNSDAVTAQLQKLFLSLA